MKNKKASMMVILIVIGAIILLVLLGVTMAIGSAVMNWVGDEILPELTGLGMVGNANVSQAMQYTAVPVNDFIQNFTWITGIIYVFGIMGIFGLAFIFRSSGEKWLIGLYVVLVLMLVIICIFMSNIYQDFYDDGSSLAALLHEHVMLSYLILYSPVIMGLIAFIAGIILFGGESEGNQPI